MRDAVALKPVAAARTSAAPPLRVALFSGNYNYVVDGPVKALNRLVSHLETRGHAALVFAPTVATPAFKHSGDLVSIPSVALPGSRSEYRLGLGLPASAKKRLDDFKPTIVHVAAPDWLGLGALNYARRLGVPAVASFHTRFDTYPRYYGMAWLEKHITGYMRYFYGRCARVYAPSQSMVDELTRDRIGHDIRLWARGVDHDLFSPARRDAAWRRSLGFADDDVIVAFVGRIVLEKGIDVFSGAVKRAARTNPRVRALVVGDGPMRAHFADLLPGAVFTGHLDGADLARAYASADIFLNPSVTETFGNVTLEAMASGLPAVCAAASGSRSLVENGATGILVSDARDDGEFARALTALAGDPARRREMSAAGRANSGAFRWEAVLDRMVDEYRDVVNAATGPAPR